VPAAVLASADRARLYAHLAAMLRAGLPLAQALANAPLPPAAQAWRKACVQRLQAGQTLSTAAHGGGVFGAEDWPLVQAGETTGALETIFDRLSERHVGRSANLRSMRSRMMMPALVLLLALLIQPLPALVSGRIGIAEAMMPVLATALLMGIAVFLGRAMLASLLRPAKGKPAVWGGLLLHLPVLGPALMRRNLRDFCESLGMLLEAGVPMFEALPTANAALSNGALRQAFGEVEDRVRAGAPLAEALAALPWRDCESLRVQVEAGEAAGRLAETLLHVAKLEREQVAETSRQLATWAPRLAYAAVVVWLARSIIGGGLPVG
jgi:type II secretory pathway component PulF